MSARTTRLFAALLLAALLPAFPLAAGGNLIANGGFEKDEIGHLAMWSMEAYTNTEAAVRFFTTAQERHSGARALAITNLEPNDSRAVQWVRVRPDTYYRLSCWVFAQGIETEAVGANISVLGTTGAAGNLTDTGGRWVPVTLYGKTSSTQESLGVLMRVGFYGSLARGLALFDDVTLEELRGAPPVDAEQVLSLGTEEPQARILAAETASPTPLQTVARGLKGLFTPSILGILQGVAAAAVLVLLTLAATHRLGRKRRRSERRLKITIEDLVYGFDLPGGLHTETSAFSMRGRRRGEDSRMEHRRSPRSRFDVPVTVRRVRGTGRLEYLKLQGANLSDGGLFLESKNLALLGLDEEVGIEIPAGDRTIDLGKAVVTRVQSPVSVRRRRLRGGFGLCFLEPPYRIHRLRQGLGRAGLAPADAPPPRPAASPPAPPA